MYASLCVCQARYVLSPTTFYKEKKKKNLFLSIWKIIFICCLISRFTQ